VNIKHPTSTKTLGPAIVFLLILFSLAPACSPPPGEGGNAEIKNNENADQTPHDMMKEDTLVVATKLYDGPIESFIEVSSDVQSLKTVELYPHLSGIQITEIFVDEGDAVSKGDLMATLDSAEIQLELDQAKANRDEVKHRVFKAEIALKEAEEKKNNAQIKETKAKKDYDKSVTMFENELVAEDELLVKKLAWEQASSDLDLARLQYDQVELDRKLINTEEEKMNISVKTADLKLTRTKIVAPFGGFVVYRSATLGMTISSSSHLFTIVNRDELTANLHIPQEDVLKIRVGMPVRIKCDAIPNIAFTGTIKIINPSIDAQSGTVKLRAEIASENRELLRPGMFISTRIITDSRDHALLIPRKAVFYDDEKPTFFLITDDDTVKKIHFTQGATTEKALEIASIDTPLEVEAEDEPEKESSDSTETAEPAGPGETVDTTKSAQNEEITETSVAEESAANDETAEDTAETPNDNNAADVQNAATPIKITVGPGSRIVIVGQDNLKDGDKVRIQKEIN